MDDFFQVGTLIIVIIIAKRTFFLCSHFENNMNGPCLNLTLQFLTVAWRIRKRNKISRSNFRNISIQAKR